MRAWLAANPDDPDAPAFQRRMDDWAWLVRRHGLRTLGFGAYLARAPA